MADYLHDERHRVATTLPQMGDCFFSHQGLDSLVELMVAAVIDDPAIVFVDGWETRIVEIQRSKHSFG